ncbi:MAG: transporter substrate-binding domain-containing protein [Oligoflexia bacterium]|nr:transporter substrate-binding domain-containing protein [Oligoflexia bacterium]
MNKLLAALVFALSTNILALNIDIPVYPPFLKEDFSGIFDPILKKIVDESKIKANIRHMPLKRIHLNILNRKAEIQYASPRQVDEDVLNSYVFIPFVDYKTVVITKKTTKNPFKDLSGKRIALQYSFTWKNKKLVTGEVVKVNSATQGLNLLKANRVDYATCILADCFHHMLKLNLNKDDYLLSFDIVNDSPVGFYIRKDLKDFKNLTKKMKRGIHKTLNSPTFKLTLKKMYRDNPVPKEFYLYRNTYQNY